MSIKDTDQFLSALFSILIDDLFSQPLYILLHRVFHFHVFVISSLLERSCLRVKIPAPNEGFRIFYPAVVRRWNGVSSFNLLTHPPSPPLPCASAEREDEPCEPVRSLPKTLRPLTMWMIVVTEPLRLRDQLPDLTECASRSREYSADHRCHCNVGTNATTT